LFIPLRFQNLFCAALLLAACSGAHLNGVDQPLAPSASEPVTILYLIGDAGGPNLAGEPVLLALEDDLRSQVDEVDRLVVFLGDNIYPDGMPAAGSPARVLAEQRLLPQVRAAVDSRTRAIFIPGNHDWDFSGPDGWNSVLRQEEFLEAAGEGLVEFLPDGGCPGPVVRDIGERVRLVLIDTEWWLRAGGKPVHPTSSCAWDSRSEILSALGEALRGAGERRVVVAGHHPLATGSPHGGYFRIGQHVFPLRDWKSWLWVPLPILGSLYPIARRSGVTEQDLAGPLNQAMRAALDSTLAVTPPLVYVSGHVHGLEVLEGGARAEVLLVSGAGNFGHADPLQWLADTRFIASGQGGYAKLEFERGGRVRLAVITVDEGAQRVEAYSAFLGRSP
jgi:hypothetical protein